MRLIELAKRFGIETFCRFDLRLGARRGESADQALEESHLYFIEINPMPTIRLGINFLNSLENLPANHPLEAALLSAARYIDRSSQYFTAAFVLACALWSVTARHSA